LTEKAAGESLRLFFIRRKGSLPAESGTKNGPEGPSRGEAEESLPDLRKEGLLPFISVSSGKAERKTTADDDAQRNERDNKSLRRHEDFSFHPNQA